MVKKVCWVVQMVSLKQGIPWVWWGQQCCQVVAWDCLFLYYCLYLIALAVLFLFIAALTWSGMCQEAFRQLILFIAEQNPHTHLQLFTPAVGAEEAEVPQWQSRCWSHSCVRAGCEAAPALPVLLLGAVSARRKGEFLPRSQPCLKIPDSFVFSCIYRALECFSLSLNCVSFVILKVLGGYSAPLYTEI